jgi:tetratricopeptide (TPR) repeat protein
MNCTRYISVIFILAAVTLLPGCHIDQNVRKQRYLESGKRFSDQGRYREAAIQYLNALKVDKNDANAHYLLAETYEHLGQTGEARRELARTVELQPANYMARIDLGILMFAVGMTDEAQKQANAVIIAHPNDADAHALLSALAGRRGQKDRALIEIHRALELDPNRAAFHDDFAILLLDDPSKIRQVEYELQNAAALAPKSINAKLLLVSFLSRNNRLPEAEKVSWSVVAADPKSLEVWEYVAQIIFKRGDRARAEQVLRQVSRDFFDNPRGVRILADYFVDSGQLDRASAEFAKLLSEFPQNAAVQKGYVRLLLQIKDRARASVVMNGLATTNPNDPEVAALNGIVQLDAGNVDKAVRVLQDGARKFPNDSSIQYWQGRAYLAIGDSTQAENSFRRATELDPTALHAEKQLACIAQQRGDTDMLADVATNTTNALPQSYEGFMWRAAAEIDRDLTEQAESDLKIAIALAPQSADPYLLLGRLRLAQKHYPEGVTLLEQALQRDPNSVAAMRILVEHELHQKRIDTALNLLNAQIRRVPENAGFYGLLAQLLMRKKSLGQAATAARKAIQLNPGDVDSVILLVRIAFESGKTARAIQNWERWIDTHPNDAGALAILGTFEESLGHTDKAEDLYRKSLKIQPQQPIAANNLAYRMLLNSQSRSEALLLAQFARRAMPNSPNTADTLAWAYYQNGDFALARDLLRDAVDAEPNCAKMHYHLGKVYSKLHDKDSAAIQFRKATSLGHDSLASDDVRMALPGPR